MKIRLDRNYDIVINSIVDIAKCIIDYSIVLFDKNDLLNRVHYILKYIDSSIDKNYSTNIVECIEENPDATTDNVFSPNIMNSLKSILQSANRVIDKIDTTYLDIDDVFFKIDNFIFLRDKVHNAFSQANEADKEFRNGWNRIISFKGPVPIADLKQMLSLTTKGKKAAESARLAYQHFGEYFDQFTATIQKMFESCNSFFSSVEPRVDRIHLALGINFNYLLSYHNSLQKAWKGLNDAIWRAYQAANLYSISHDEYKNLESAITHKLYVTLYS